MITNLLTRLSDEGEGQDSFSGEGNTLGGGGRRGVTTWGMLNRKSMPTDEAIMPLLDDNIPMTTLQVTPRLLFPCIAFRNLTCYAYCKVVLDPHCTTSETTLLLKLNTTHTVQELYNAVAFKAGVQSSKFDLLQGYPPTILLPLSQHTLAEDGLLKARVIQKGR